MVEHDATGCPRLGDAGGDSLMLLTFITLSSLRWKRSSPGSSSGGRPRINSLRLAIAPSTPPAAAAASAHAVAADEFSL